MKIRARAPGKLVILGEYAVLTGAPALVAAIDRHCEVTIGDASTSTCHITSWAPDATALEFAQGGLSGLGIVDTVTAATAGAPAHGWHATLDSRPLYGRSGSKYGFGSSAAALTAFAAAYTSYVAGNLIKPQLLPLIQLHRDFQDGRGSGIDVAAALNGGLVRFSIDKSNQVNVGSVQLPNSVGFAGIFTGVPATTPDFVSRFNLWREVHSVDAQHFVARMQHCALTGCDAANTDDSAAFIAAIDQYGVLLDELGQRIGRDVVTPEHRQIKRLADRRGVAYKVSGAGGGDIGVAFSTDANALEKLATDVIEAGFEWLELAIDERGLVIEELIA